MTIAFVVKKHGSQFNQNRFKTDKMQMKKYNIHLKIH